MRAELSIGCATCGAERGHPCVSVGRVVPAGAAMQRYHAARTHAAPEVRDIVASAIRSMGGGLRLEEICAMTGLEEGPVWRALRAERASGRMLDRGERGWFLAAADPLRLATALERYARKMQGYPGSAFNEACAVANEYRYASGDDRFSDGFVLNASEDEILEAMRALRGPMVSTVKLLGTRRVEVGFRFDGRMGS